MSVASFQAMNQATLSAGSSVGISNSVDLGESRELEVVVTVVTPASIEEDDSSPKLLIRHAPRDVAELYIDFPTPIEVDLTTAGTTWFHVPYFTRFVAWLTSGTLGSDAVVSVDFTGKS